MRRFAARELRPCRGARGMPPHSFSSCRKRTLQRGFSCRYAAIHLLRRARGKKKALGRINLTPLCQVDRNTGVAVAGAVPTCGLVPGAPHPGKTEKCFPAFGGVCAAFARPGGGNPKGRGRSPPFCVVRGCGGESKRPHVSGRGSRGRCLCAKDISPLVPHSPGGGVFFSFPLHIFDGNDILLESISMR